MDKRPLVCVVVATMNAREHLQECLDSIYEQTNASWEILLIDGGSTDGTQELTRRNAKRIKYWVSEPDRGVYDAWNKALPHVSAKWVIFLGADDRLRDENVLKNMAPLLEDPELNSRLVYGRVAFTAHDGSVLRQQGRPWDQIAKRFSKEMCIPHQGVFHRSDIFQETGFDPKFRYAGDYALLLGEIAHRPPVFHDLCIAAWRQGGLTSNAGQSISVLREFRLARAQHGFTGGHPYWIEFKAWIKYWLVRLFGAAPAQRVLEVCRRLR
jgi:glycosyltransferase involved in cell wall biosynthesis